jgi:DHA1 family bicyclomycin/chloramphenicol resistance-like MFS transporter
MALVIAGGMLAANVMLLLVARPWQLPVEAVDPAAVTVH